MKEVKLITLDPGHFHAALVQKQMYAGLAPQVHVYAPLGPDLLAHLQRIAGFNSRPAGATDWRLEVHAGPDYRERLLHEKPGNVVVLSGRNRGKIAAIADAIGAGLHVLADKPWVLVPEDLPRLAAVLDQAERARLVAYDIMTERFEITSILQRELVNDPEVFGQPVPGDAGQPGVCMKSVHYLLKQVAGVPLRRPPWFFDTTQQGEGLTDVGTHLVDLVMWVLFPDQAIDASQDIAILSARRWPTSLGRADFQRVTGEADFPAFLGMALRNDRLDYFCNTQVDYRLRGIHVQLHVLWDLEAPPGVGDSHLAVFAGSRARVEVRQGAEERYRPEVYVAAADPGQAAAVRAALARKVAALQNRYPGVELADRAAEWHLVVPDSYRVGHEAHFGQVTEQFLRYLGNPASLPAWEKTNMLAKYTVTTQGVHRAAAAESP